jgi:glycosyltransferase involved in cell wall biosynthesis
VANLKPLKQPEVFVRLASQLRELADVRFTMVGAPPGARRRGGRWYQELVQSLDATPNVAHVGRKAHPEVNELLATAHVLVNTSLHEGFPNTYIQAWMREVPVVSLHIDPDGVLRREGIGIHAQTEERLVEAVRMLVTDPAERAAYGARARQYAMLRHSMRNARFIEQLIATGRVEHTGEDLVSHSGR